MLGVEAHPIEVKVALALGLSRFTIVGLPDGAIKESGGTFVASNAYGNLQEIGAFSCAIACYS